MSIITDRINVSITREAITRIVPATGNILLIGQSYAPSPDPTVAEVKEYSTLAGVSEDFPENLDSNEVNLPENANFTAGEYRSAVSVFSQNPRPRMFMLTQKTTGGIVDTFNQAVAQTQNNFYGVVTTPAVSSADLFSLAAAVQASGDKFLYIGTKSNAVLQDTNGNLAANLKAANIERAAITYNSFNDINPIAPAMASLMLSKPLGSASYAYKAYNNVVGDYLLKTADINKLKANNVNYYVDTGGGKGRLLEGVTCAGEWIDSFMVGDFLKFGIQQAIANIFYNVDKVGYTDTGAALLDAAISAACLDAANKELILPDFRVTMPLARTQSIYDRAARRFPGIEVDATFTNAIHSVDINVKIQL